MLSDEQKQYSDARRDNNHARVNLLSRELYHNSDVRHEKRPYLAGFHEHNLTRAILYPESVTEGCPEISTFVLIGSDFLDQPCPLHPILANFSLESVSDHHFLTKQCQYICPQPHIEIHLKTLKALIVESD